MTEQFWTSLLDYLDLSEHKKFCDLLQKEYHIRVRNHDNSEAPTSLLAKQLAKWESTVWTVLQEHYLKSYDSANDAIKKFSPNDALSVIGYLKYQSNMGDINEDFLTKLIAGELAFTEPPIQELPGDSSTTISLRRVNFPNQHDDIWLERIADLDGESLSVFSQNEAAEPISSNRKLIFRSDGPDTPYLIGFWEWYDYAQQRDGATKWRTEASYIEDISPVELFPICDKYARTIDLIGLLKKGVDIPTYLCFPCLFTGSMEPGDCVEAILYQKSDFDIRESEQKGFHHISLKQIVYSVTCYSITTADCIGWKNRKILRTVRLDKYSSPKIIPIIDADTLVKKAIASRMTKNLYKDNIGGTIKEWRECKDLFQLVCSPTLYEDIAGMLHCSIQQAKENVDLFISRINSNFDLGDIDSDVLARIAMNHDGLRTQCEAAVEEHWKTTHAEALAEAQIELDQKKQAAENIVNEYKSQFEKIKADKKNAEEAYQKILTETAEAQAKLDQLLKEIEKYETLGANAVQAIRDKIGSAQQDMAGFIAELSTFMPQQCVQSGSTNRWTFTPGEVCHRMDNLEGCSSWTDTFELLCDNLQLAGIGSQWTTMLSSFLYSSYLNRMPLLLAGPNAKAIADALSMTICGQKIDLLTCCGEQDAEAISGFVDSDMAAVQNPFHPDWVSCISHSNNGFALWLHPFTEDLQIEPRSLYHYAYPVFTECFVDQLPSVENMDAGQEMVEYDEFKPDPKYRAKMGPVKKLGLSRLMLSRLEKVLADAKCIGSISDTSMECLFGMLPMCVLSGKQEALAELLDSEKNIKSEVQAELQRYVEE